VGAAGRPSQWRFAARAKGTVRLAAALARPIRPQDGRIAPMAGLCRPVAVAP